MKSFWHLESDKISQGFEHWALKYFNSCFLYTLFFYYFFIIIDVLLNDSRLLKNGAIILNNGFFFNFLMEPGRQASQANFNITKDINIYFQEFLELQPVDVNIATYSPKKADFCRFEAFKRKEKREFVTKYSISTKLCCPLTIFHPKK